MNNYDLKFALALNDKGKFEKKHFGDTYNFVIYNIDVNRLVKNEELRNDFIDLDEKSSHGSAAKGKAIVARLKDSGVSILVSMQFGKNLKIINSHFIPIIIYDDNPDIILPTLNQNINILFNELQNKVSNYSTFIIKNGVFRKIGEPESL